MLETMASDARCLDFTDARFTPTKVSTYLSGTYGVLCTLFA